MAAMFTIEPTSRH